jgi:hypothetical protein
MTIQQMWVDDASDPLDIQQTSNKRSTKVYLYRRTRGKAGISKGIWV